MTVDDIVTRVSLLANKTGAANEKTIRDTVVDVIDTINAEMQNFTIASRDKTISVTTANYKVITMPVRCRRIIELGRYDSTGDRINPVFEEITERQFHAMFSGSTTIATHAPLDGNLYCLIDDAPTTRARQIRLVYPPSSSFTMEVRFFEQLTDQNVDRLESQGLLFSGTVARLGTWFPNDQALHFKLYEDGIELLKGNQRSLNHTIPEKVNRETAIHNIIAGSLVN